MVKKCVLLLSGGLDTTTVLAIIKAQGYTDVYAMSFSYGQRNSAELDAAKRIAQLQNVKAHKIVEIDLRAFGGSALTSDIAVPKDRNIEEAELHVPITYVPARNTIFLSYALGWAEVLGVFDIFIGVNAIDYSGYPDCRPAYIAAFEAMANLGIAASVKGEGRFTIHAPLINMSKASIIAKGLSLGVDYSMTLSCYDPDEEGRACGHCDACQLRLRGFAENGVDDPARYVR